MPIESQIINSTGKTIVTINALPDSNYLLPTLLIIATFAIAITTIITMISSNKRQDRQITILENQNNATALLEVFKMLNNDTHKNAESALIDNYRAKENPLYENQILRDPPFGSSMNIVCRDYDQIGLLIKRGLIPEKDFFNMFGKLVITYHQILFQEIRRRRLLGESDYMTNFTNLAIQCYDYWEQKGRDRLPRDPKSNGEITRENVNFWKESLPK